MFACTYVHIYTSIYSYIHMSVRIYTHTCVFTCFQEAEKLITLIDESGDGLIQFWKFLEFFKVSLWPYCYVHQTTSTYD